MKVKTWAWRPDSKFQGYSVVTIGNCLDSIFKKYGEEVSPKQIVNEARRKKSPLHSLIFNCPIKQAAQYYYEQRARQLLNSIKVVFINEPKKMRTAFVNVRFKEKPTGTIRSFYTPAIRAMKDSEYTKYILEEALDYLEGAERRFSDLKELSEVFKAIRNARRKFNKKNKRKK